MDALSSAAKVLDSFLSSYRRVMSNLQSLVCSYVTFAMERGCEFRLRMNMFLDHGQPQGSDGILKTLALADNSEIENRRFRE